MAKPDDELTEPEREQRRQAGTSHGASSYLARLADGRMITAAMALCESEVFKLYAEGGERAMVEAAAVKFDTAARLVWQHMDRARPEEIEALLPLWRKLQRDAVATWQAYHGLPGPNDDGAIDLTKYRQGEPDAA